MSKISGHFKKLLTSIDPGSRVHGSLNTHASTIQSRLGKEFETRTFRIVGSYSRGTMVAKYSDLDCFVVFSRDEATWGDKYIRSTTLLDRIKSSIQERYKNTEIKRDKQAVVVHFSDLDVDIVPAIWERMIPNPEGKNRPVYRIPDGNEGWLITSPDLHNEYIAEADAHSRGMLKFVSRLLKFWRECRSPRIPISSFHVELVLAFNGTCTGVKTYAQCIADGLDLLSKRKLAAIRDPLSISGLIEATRTASQRETAFRSVENSALHAAKAIYFEEILDYSEAWRQWNIVFNDQFPRSST
jgi:predicted nucleotidyltransferase